MPQTFFPRQNEPCLPQVSEMPRDRRLWSIQGADQVADTELSTLEQMQDPQAGRVRERPEDCFRE